MLKKLAENDWALPKNFLFVVPALGMFLAFSLYPYMYVIFLSFHESSGSAVAELSFVGFKHYVEIFTDSPRWWLSVRSAGYITFLALTLQNAVALLLAWLVDRGIRAAQTYRSIYFLPPVLSGVAVALVWGFIYEAEYGLLNNFLINIGLENWTRAWLSNEHTQLNSLAVIHMWKGFGWGFIILLAGLQGIPRELYEAARVDGAGDLQIFRKITFPLMIPVFVLVGVLTVLGSMQIYDLIAATTKGAINGTAPMWEIVIEIGRGRAGFACALGLIFGVILVIAAVLQLRFSKRAQLD